MTFVNAFLYESDRQEILYAITTRKLTVELNVQFDALYLDNM